MEELICPHCGHSHELDPTYFYEEANDDWEDEQECDTCNKTIKSTYLINVEER